MPSATPLERSILATLAYFDVFDYPLRVEEVWRWLYVVDRGVPDAVASASPADVERTLSTLAARGLVDRAGSYISLAGRSRIVATRVERQAASKRKWKRARLVAGVLRFIPFTRFIGVVNTLAIDNARPESDIDFFIVARRTRLWLTRLMSTVIVYALGVRRHGTKIANRVCLSFYVTDVALDLEPLRVSPDEEDTYLAYWVTQVVPLFERGNTGRAFRDANEWARSFLPHGFNENQAAALNDPLLVRVLRWPFELLLQSLLGSLLEWLARTVQTAVMSQKTESRRLAPTTDVVVSDDVLKFHERDRRREYREAFRTKLASFQLTS